VVVVVGATVVVVVGATVVVVTVVVVVGATVVVVTVVVVVGATVVVVVGATVVVVVGATVVVVVVVVVDDGAETWSARAVGSPTWVPMKTRTKRSMMSAITQPTRPSGSLSTRRRRFIPGGSWAPPT
jgi:hypothetical protein